MGRKLGFSFSLLYLALLAYNLFAAQFVSSLISLLLFLLTSPYFFKKAKAKSPALRKAASVVGWMPLAFFAVVVVAGLMEGGSDVIPAEEQAYIDTVLSQITPETTKADAIELLGTPSRDRILQLNWWVSFDGRRSRVGIYFSAAGTAEEVVLDGGWGKFYYRVKA